MPAQKVTTKIVVSALMGALFLSFATKALAAPLIVINSYPSSSIAGYEMEIGYTSTQLDPNTNYYIKSLGGFNDYEVQTFNSGLSIWLAWNNAWSDMPQITSSTEGTISVTLKARFKEDATSGTKNLRIRIRKVGTDTNYDSPPVVIDVSTPPPSPSPSPSSNLNPSPSPSSSSKTSSKNGIYKINEVKDENGEGLSSVLIYVDNIYIHHYTPEILTFCDGCRCNNYVDCGFGIHTIRLEKNNFNNWSETKTINLEDYYEVNPIMQPIDLSSPSPSPTPTPIIPSKSPSPIPTRLDLVGESATSSPDETTRLDLVGAESQTTESGEVLGEKKKNSFTLSLVLIGLGLGLLAATGVVFVKGNKYNKSL